MEDKKVGIIIVNFNGLHDTLECIESIQRSTYKNYRIVVIDNCSEEDPCFAINKKDIICKRLSRNEGFGVANNIGVEIAIKDGADLLLCLNNDTVIDKDMLRILINNYHKNTILTTAMYYFSEPQKLWYGGGEISKILGTFAHKKYKKSRFVTFITGCCMLIPKECIENIGLFEKEYFMYYEDGDFSLKAQLNGYKLKYIYEAKLWHKVGGSIKKYSGIKEYYLNRNRIYILNKYGRYFFYTAKIYFYCTRFILILINKVKGNDIEPIINGIRDGKNGL